MDRSLEGFDVLLLSEVSRAQWYAGVKDINDLLNLTFF